MVDKIDSFSGENRFLSNFWPVPNKIVFRDLQFGSVEHAYVASKSLDPVVWGYLSNTDASPGVVKRYGRTIKVRDDWDQVKLGFMEDFVRQKFFLNIELREKLLATGDAKLIEGNTWGDTFWGVDSRKGGYNHLGRILMQVRKDVEEYLPR